MQHCTVQYSTVQYLGQSVGPGLEDDHEHPDGDCLLHHLQRGRDVGPPEHAAHVVQAVVRDLHEYSAVQYSTVQYSSVQYSTVLSNTFQELSNNDMKMHLIFRNVEMEIPTTTYTI